MAEAPEAWGAGWRLANEAEPIWNEYVSLREAMAVEPVEEISMQALTTMATYILQRYANKTDFRGLTPEQVTDVVTAAGLLQLETPARKDGDRTGGDGSEYAEDDD